MSLPIKIDFPTLAVFISVSSVVLVGVTTLYNVVINGKQFRLGFITSWILTLISVIAIIYVIRPIEIALISVLLITGTMSIFLALLVRQHYRTSFLNNDDVSQSGRINQLHNHEMNYVLSCMINGLSQGTASEVPYRERSLYIHISNFQEAFKAATRHMEFRFSILETLPNGKFAVAFTTPNIDLIVRESMIERFQWKNTVKGVAGECASTNKFVLCDDIQDTDKREACKWISLDDDENSTVEVGSILCVPIPYPKNYKRKDKDGECLGVLSITCSKPRYLRKAHANWIEKWYIDALINIILVYKLNEEIEKIFQR